MDRKPLILMFYRYELNYRKDVPSFVKLFNHLTGGVLSRFSHFTGVQCVPDSGMVLWLTHTILVKAQGLGVVFFNPVVAILG